ncbi:hypothetical protein F66182_7028 [Fusarium sp. NRRL 66182]|nr:hypothetical protein F66182_7028 [Fusarium sp. NRRL 66182]
MPNDLDKSLADRLQALRGTSAARQKPASTEINVDLVERKKTPTREDALAARLKSLRERGEASPTPEHKPHESAKPTPAQIPPKNPSPKLQAEDDDAIFQTDDQTLEELLGDVEPGEGFQPEPDDAQVKALLEELANSIPQDEDGAKKRQDDSDDSDGEAMNRDVDRVIARFRDEAEVEAALAKNKSPEPEPGSESEQEQETGKPSDMALPDVPSNLADMPSSTRAASADMDDITARLAALRAPSPEDPSLALPSVPTSKPSKPVSRLTSRTNYTDDDVESWCTVCLEDATLRCPGCEDDVYCTRCWYEMHRGPQAGFDERRHKAVQFTKENKAKVAVGV